MVLTLKKLNLVFLFLGFGGNFFWARKGRLSNLNWKFFFKNKLNLPDLASYHFGTECRILRGVSFFLARMNHWIFWKIWQINFEEKNDDSIKESLAYCQSFLRGLHKWKGSEDSLLWCFASEQDGEKTR